MKVLAPALTILALTALLATCGRDGTCGRSSPATSEARRPGPVVG